jgi:phage gp46-like protein
MSRVTRRQWLGAYLVNEFSFELRDKLVKTLVIGLNADGANEFLDVRSRGRGVSTDTNLEEKVGSKITHLRPE